MDCICAIDQGTTGTTVIILDADLSVRARVNQEFPQIYPKPSWVEHDPEAIWDSTLETLRRASADAGIDASDIRAIGITNQRETTVVWDRATGVPVHNAIVWQDRRTSDRIEALVEAGHRDSVHQKTGLLLDPYFSGTKVAWILDHVPGARERANRGELAFGTIDTFLLWRLTQGASHKTDISNGSRTLLMDLSIGEWDEDMLKLFDVPRELLPTIERNTALFGEVRGVPGLRDGTPICGIAGDQQAALFGQTCFDPGEAKCTFGTGAFLLMNAGRDMVLSQHEMLTTAAWDLGDGIVYALEGSAFIAGAMVQWLRDGLKLIEHASEIEGLASKVEDTAGVVVVPALSGLGAPHWNPRARGLIWGLTRGTTDAHIARAALEGIAFQNADILRAMEQDAGGELHRLKVDGGACANDLLMQIQADLLGRTIVRPQMTETTALGAALMAGLGVGIFDDLADIRETWRADATFSPALSDEARQAANTRWQEGLSRV
jgi:glycerol kinase